MDNLLAYDRQAIWHPFTPLTGASDPVVINRGDGVYLITEDDRKIIDAISSWWVNIHGHANPVLAEALRHQAMTLEHVIFAGFTHEPAVRLARNLLSILPKNQAKIFFSDNGSTAVEVAIKMCLQYWHNQGKPRKRIIAIEGAYHGDTFGAMAVGDRGIFTAPFAPFLFHVDFIEFPSRHKEDSSFNHFKELIDSGEIAGIIVEPLVQAAGGMRMYSSGWLNKVFDYARKAQVVTIADEVFTGFGRTGELFASDYLETKPDIMTLSKGITGGTMPLGVTTCCDRIAAAFTSDDFLKTFFHGHSYTGNPLACAVANASFGLLMEDACVKARKRIEQKHLAFKEKINHSHALIDIRCLGTIIAFELRTEEGTKYDNALRKRIYPYFLERNILLRPLGNIFYILPPYTITDEQLDIVYNAIEEFLKSIN